MTIKLTIATQRLYFRKTLFLPLSERTSRLWPWRRRQVKLRKAKLTECTEDDRSTSKLLSGPHGGYYQLILRISPEAAQSNRFAVSCDHRHHPVTNHLAVMILVFKQTWLLVGTELPRRANHVLTRPRIWEEQKLSEKKITRQYPRLNSYWRSDISKNCTNIYCVWEELFYSVWSNPRIVFTYVAIWRVECFLLYLS